MQIASDTKHYYKNCFGGYNPSYFLLYFNDKFALPTIQRVERFES